MRSMPRLSRAVRLLVVSLLSTLPLSAQDESPVREMLRFVDGGSATEQPVKLELSSLRERQVLLPLPDGQTVVVDRTDLEVRRAGDSTWRGRIAGPSGEPAGDVVLTVRDGRVLGTIMVPGATWRIVPEEGGGHRMREVDESHLDRFEIDGREPLPGLAEGADAQNAQDIPRLLRAPAAGNAPISRFNAIALYTAAARQAAGGHEAIRQQLQHQVDFANTAYINSKVQIRLEMPYMEETSIPDSGFRNLLWIQYDPSVIALQRRYGAAFSVLVPESGSGCGIAGRILRPDAYRDRRATLQGGVIIRRPCLENLNFLLAHEIGHTMGCEHDPAWGSPLQSALFPYAYGYFVDGSFRTVMSYSNECRQGCPPALHFSNPAIRFNGVPTGIPGQRDNARVLNATRTRFAPPPAPTQRCQPGLNTLCLGGRRFKVQVDWYNQFDDNSGVGRTIQRTDSSGFFTFGDPSNVELMVKALDFGNTVKVFYGQLTNLSFDLIITDTKTGAFKVYSNTPGNCGGIDQNAFPGGAVAAATSSRTAAAAAGCRPGPQTLCLKNGRFQVTSTWRNPANGQSGQAGAVPLSQVTGAFYFSGPDSLELMTKIIDQGDRIDFFFGTLSDLEYTIQVTDTRTGRAKTYRNNAGRYCGGLEVDAF